MLPSIWKSRRTENHLYQLLTEIKDGTSVLFIGSDVLIPSRVQYIPKIIEKVEKEKEENKSKEQSTTESLAMKSMSLFMRFYNLVAELTSLNKEIQYSHSNKKANLEMSKEIDEFISKTKNILQELTTVLMESDTNKGHYERVFTGIKKDCTDLIDTINNYALKDKSGDNILTILTKLLEQIDKIENTYRSQENNLYKQLYSYINNLWPISVNDDISRLVSCIGMTNSIITTIFDDRIEKTFKELGKNITVITGTESTNSEFVPPNNKSYILLYQIVGTIEKPETLHISKDMLLSLRDRIKNSVTSINFLKDILKNKNLVVLGYNNEDIYDSFFREVVNDISYRADESLSKNIYMVNKIKYDTYYGLWENRDENEIIVVDISPSDFINRMEMKNKFGANK